MKGHIDKCLKSRNYYFSNMRGTSLRLSLKRTFSSIAKTRQIFKYKPLDLKTNEIRLLTATPLTKDPPVLWPH